MGCPWSERNIWFPYKHILLDLGSIISEGVGLALRTMVDSPRLAGTQRHTTDHQSRPSHMWQSFLLDQWMPRKGSVARRSIRGAEFRMMVRSQELFCKLQNESL